MVSLVGGSGVDGDGVVCESNHLPVIKYIHVQFKAQLSIFRCSSLQCQLHIHVILVKIRRNMHLGLSNYNWNSGGTHSVDMRPYGCFITIGCLPCLGPVSTENSKHRLS